MPHRQNISVPDLRRALRAYWRHAWPGSDSVCPTYPDWKGMRLLDVLRTFQDESGPCPRHVLRLGNHIYPHMKFAVERGLSGGDFYFVADCHDTAPCPGHEDPQWQGLRMANRAIKDAIEGAWFRAGLPTLTSLAREAAEGSQHLRPAGPRILLVDDEPANLQLTGAILRADGFTIASSSNGAEAIEQAVFSPPDLVVSDYEMPGMTGREVARKIKDAVETREVPVLICTYSNLVLGDLQPADAVLRRPFNAETLKQTVQRLIQP